MKNVSLTTSVNPFRISFTNQAQEAPKLEVPIDQANDYLKRLIEQFRREIILLKKYICRINTEIRKNLNIEIPSFEEAFQKTVSGNTPIDSELLNEWMNQMINVEYINPLFGLYDVHIKNLEDEISQLKQQMRKYDSQISDFINENKTLRQSLTVCNQEFQNFLSVKIQSGNEKSNVVIDHDYMVQLKQRSALLSKENEIVIRNYQNVQKENYELTLNTNDKLRNYNEKAETYDQLNQAYQELMNQYNMINDIAQTNEVKMLEQADKANRFEIENDLLKSENDQFKAELRSINEANAFYKQYLDKLNIKT